MKVWIVKDFEDTIVDIFKTKEGAYSYMCAEMERWRDEHPREFTLSDYKNSKKQLDNEYKANIGGMHTWLLDNGFYLKAGQYNVKE